MTNSARWRGCWARASTPEPSASPRRAPNVTAQVEARILVLCAHESPNSRPWRRYCKQKVEESFNSSPTVTVRPMTTSLTSEFSLIAEIARASQTPRKFYRATGLRGARAMARPHGSGRDRCTPRDSTSRRRSRHDPSACCSGSRHRATCSPRFGRTRASRICRSRSGWSRCRDPGSAPSDTSRVTRR